MATPAQIAANRRNAKCSTGPRTAEGKAAVRLNSLTHGLRARDAVLPDEDVDAFDELQRAFHDQFQPVGPAELFCVEKMILSFWRNRRVSRIEADLYMQFYPKDAADFGPTGAPGVLGRSFTMDSFGTDNFSRLSRYESGLDRAFYRASKELQALQKTRIGFARQNQEPESAPVNKSIDKQQHAAAAGAPAPTPINEPRPISATSALNTAAPKETP